LGHRVNNRYFGSRSGAGASTVLLAVLLAALLPAAVSRAQVAEGNPRLAPPVSHLNEPFETPVFLTGHIGLGGDFDRQAVDVCYGGSLIFRPGHAVNIFSSFLDWTTGMVLQVDHLETPDGGSVLSGDLIARRYFGNRGDRSTEVRLFLGLGSGVSDVRRPGPADEATGQYWSIMVEGGQEWYFSNSFFFFFKGQYRWMINAGRTWRAWSVQAGLGVPWP
jgi:hypothetical protein